MDKTKLLSKKRIILFIIFLIIIAAATILTIPLIKLLVTAEGRAKIQAMVESHETSGAFLFIGLQFIQVVIAVIPGEPVEIIGGVLFGAFGGFLFCMIGALAGTISVFYLVKLLGYPLVSSFFDRKKLKHLKILEDSKKLETIVFILFLIPGTPKDALTYIVPLTKMKASTFFIYSSIARIPSVIGSTIVGSNIGKGNWMISIIIFLITAAIGLVGILYNDKILKKVKSIKGKDEIKK